MNNSKKPSEPVEEERWVKMEKEIKRLKRTTSLLVVSLLLQSIRCQAHNFGNGLIFKPGICNDGTQRIGVGHGCHLLSKWN